MRRSRASERVPGRLRRELEITEISAKPEADTGSDRNHDDVVGGERGHAEAADEVGGAVDAAEALIDRIGRRQLVNQHHGACAFAAHVEADRRPFPEHAAITGVASIELAIAIAEPDHDGAAALLAEDVAVRLTPLAEGLLDHLREPTRYRAEELVAGSDDLVGG